MKDQNLNIFLDNYNPSSSSSTPINECCDDCPAASAPFHTSDSGASSDDCNDDNDEEARDDHDQSEHTHYTVRIWGKKAKK